MISPPKWPFGRPTSLLFAGPDPENASDGARIVARRSALRQPRSKALQGEAGRLRYAAAMRSPAAGASSRPTRRSCGPFRGTQSPPSSPASPSRRRTPRASALFGQGALGCVTRARVSSSASGKRWIWESMMGIEALSDAMMMEEGVLLAVSLSICVSLFLEV